MKIDKNSIKYKAFVSIVRVMNSKFKVVPILFGSLGLSFVIDRALQINDVDILVPDELFKEKWDALVVSMKYEGYGLTDQNEHEFTKNNIVVAFAKGSVLLKDNDIDPTKLSTVVKNGIRYRVLTPEQFKTVYEYSVKDGYRQKKRGGADLDKIALINSYIQNNDTK